MKTSPFPKRLWFYATAMVCGPVLLYLNFLRTDSWTGDKPFSEFAQRDWMLFGIFLAEELVILLLTALFWILYLRLVNKLNAARIAQWEQTKYAGIRPGDYDYVWFDIGGARRALIVEQKGQYHLSIEHYCDQSENWSIAFEIVYDDFDALKAALFYDFGFICVETTATHTAHAARVPIDRISAITSEGIAYISEHGYHITLPADELHALWRQTHNVEKTTPRYVGDRCRSRGEFIFYTESPTIFFANEDQMHLWEEMRYKLYSAKLATFDID